MKDLIDRLRGRSEKAFASFTELAERVAAGETVSEKAIEAACLAAGVSLSAFADQADVMMTRKQAWDGYHARDWTREKHDLAATLRETRASAEAVREEIAALRGELKSLGDAERSWSGKLNELNQEEQQARRRMIDTLRQTGSPGDWRAVGEPEPRPQRPQPGERFNIGSGQSTNGNPVNIESKQT
ncbi:hypothetical protein [Botrimarina sp.]|uniref:hypothetical protein n=1 Tax=Botrimarina sp. TaxID=2795802 RepID=UPI0032EB67D2